MRRAGLSNLKLVMVICKTQNYSATELKADPYRPNPMWTGKTKSLNLFFQSWKEKFLDFNFWQSDIYQICGVFIKSSFVQEIIYLKLKTFEIYQIWWRFY